MKHFLAAGFLVLCLLSPAVGRSQTNCAQWEATVIFVDGLVEIRRSGDNRWVPLRAGMRICLGDAVNTGPRARASILQPGDTEAMISADATLVFGESQDENLTWIEVLRGMFKFISRDPRALRITTPFLNAGLEGTEFLVTSVGDEFSVTVYEGEVLLDNESGVLSVSDGRKVVVRAGNLGQATQQSADRGDLLWALYFPAVIDGTLPDADATLPAATGDRLTLQTARAQRRLSLGLIDDARADLDAVLAIDAAYAPALAVAGMLELGAGRPDAARQLVQRALRTMPDSVPALLADSYLRLQADDLRGALESARHAVAVAPDNATAQARLANVLIAGGAVREAVAAANMALTIDPASAAARTALGFAALRNGDLDSAFGHFDAAIVNDPTASVPRLGLAVAMKRIGRDSEGREQLEVAVILDVNNALLRSYMGRAYFDELRQELAATQLDLAESVGPAAEQGAGPYDALLLQSENRTVEAFQEIRAATRANGNVPVFGSRPYYDEDLISRSAGIGKIYVDAGAAELALREGAYATLLDPADFAGHRLLGDTLNVRPRYEIARVSEYRQSQLLAPFAAVASAPPLGQPTTFIMDSAGAASLTHLEPRTSFVQNGLNFQVSAVGAGNGTRGDDAVVSGISDQLSFSIGHSHYRTDGFRPNNDLDLDIITATVQVRGSAETSWLLEARSARTEKGDLRLLWDSSLEDFVLRQKEQIDSLVLGVSHRMSPFNTVLATVQFDSVDLLADRGAVFSIFDRADRAAVEMQLISELPQWNILAGFRANQTRVDETTDFLAPSPLPPFAIPVSDFVEMTDRDVNAYVYANRLLGNRFIATIGVSHTQVDGRTTDADATNAKLGLVFRPMAETTLRIGAYETFQANVLSKQLTQPSLEPTQIAGAGQYLFGVEGEQARNYVIGADHALTPDLRIGVEHFERSIDVPFELFLGPTSPTISSFDVRESTDRASVYWTPDSRLAFRAGWQDEDFDYHGQVSPFGFSRLRTERVPVEARVFFSQLLSLRITGTHIRQKGTFSIPGPFPVEFSGESQFQVFDAAVGFRLPNRHGTVELAIWNILDERFRFQDTDPENPHVLPERLPVLRFSLSL